MQLRKLQNLIFGGKMYKIVDKEILNDLVEKMVVEAPFIAKKCGAGQFLMVMVEENGERIPLTIADYDMKPNLGKRR